MTEPERPFGNTGEEETITSAIPTRKRQDDEGAGAPSPGHREKAYEPDEPQGA